VKNPERQMDNIAPIVNSGSLIFAVPIAFAAGILAFLSPCVLPLAPGYISYITGLTGAELTQGRKGRVLLGSSLFVLGFSVVFVSYLVVSVHSCWSTRIGSIGFSVSSWLLWASPLWA
jgi:cytochrome c biogenesis protein CcdA